MKSTKEKRKMSNIFFIRSTMNMRTFMIMATIIISTLMIVACTAVDTSPAPSHAENNAVPSSYPLTVATPEPSSATPTQSEEKQDYYVEISDNIKIDIRDADIDSTKDMSTVGVDFISFDEKTVSNVFFKDIITTAEQNGENYRIIDPDSNANCNYYTGNANQNLTYMREYPEYIFNLLYWQPDHPSNNLSRFSDGKEFDFASKEEAISAISNTLENLDLESYGEFSVYSLEHDKLQMMENEMSADPSYSEYNFKGDWHENDDCYFVMFDCVINDMPVTDIDTRYIEDEATIAGSYGMAIYSKNGMEFFQIQNLYDSTESNELLPTISLKVAVDKVVEKLNSMILFENSYVITDAMLKYIPQYTTSDNDKIILIPSWNVEVTESGISDKDNEEYINSNIYLIDAYSGKEL